MSRPPFWFLPAVGLLLTTSASAQTLSFGNVNVQQNDNLNNTTSVTVTLEYSQGSMAVRSGSNRGDYNLQFTPQANQDRASGILITTASQNGRENSDAGDTPAVRYATTANFNSGGSWVVSMINTSGGEWNTDFAAAWFPYSEGWIGGHATAPTSPANSALNGFVGSAGITLTSTAPGAEDTNYIYDDPATNGVYRLKLDGISAMTDGILLTVGGDNTDNYALSQANADGTWTVMVADNGTNGNSGENTSFGFVYVPKTKVVISQDQAGIHAMGRVNGNMTRDVTAGDYVLVRSGLGTYKLYALGLDPAAASLLLGMELATGDNILTYEAIDHGWVIANRDLPGAGLQDAGSGDLLSFTLMAGGNTAAVWDSGGGDVNWSTAGNWATDLSPAAGRDVILGASGSSVNIDTAQEAGMVFIRSDTAFNLTGSAPLTIKTGLVLNSAPTSAQTHTVSAPIILGDHAFIISQSTTTSANTLKFDVASGNAVTSDGYDLTLSGAGTIEFRDAISLGAGKLIKEGDGQVNLFVANSVGSTVITSGPTGTTSGAFRLLAPQAYGAFGTGLIQLQGTRADSTVEPTALATTALFFDSGAGSGDLNNDIEFQSTVNNVNMRFLVDSASSMNVNLNGLISGGNATSRFVISSDAANGQGKFHLTNTSNSFLAEHIQIDRGGLFIYGDGSLGNEENDIYLNTNNTNANTGSGLHFGAENIVLNEKRSVFVNSTSVIHTEGYDATIAGVISGAGQLVKEGMGTLYLTGTNTLIGKMRVNGGIVAISSEENLGADPGTFAADQLALSDGSLMAMGDMVIDDANRGISMESGGGNFITNGYHVRIDSVISGVGVLSKWGAGTLELTAQNSYEATMVREGTLLVNNPTGRATGTGTVNVSRDATLAGRSNFSGAVVVEGYLDPGMPTATGSMTFTGGLQLLADSHTRFHITSDAEYDQIFITGGVFNVDALAYFDVVLNGDPTAGWVFDFMDWTSFSGDQDLADNFVLPDLSAWQMGWNKDRLNEGRLEIVSTVVPEPSRALLILGGVMACVMRRRRKAGC